MRLNLFLKEEKNEIKHLDHLEDLFLLKGFDALKDLKSFLNIYSTEIDKNSKVLSQVKIDGSPALVFGTDPLDNKFFLSTKGAFATSQKLPKSIQDIKLFFSGDLAKKLSIAFYHLKDYNISAGLAYQADLVFTSSDKKDTTIDGDKYISFKQNIITYAVKEGSHFYDQVQAAKIGLVVHTKYKIYREEEGPLKFSQEGLDFSSLTSQTNKNVFLIDNVIKSDRITTAELKNKTYVFGIVKEIESRIKSINDFISLMKKSVPDLQVLFLSFINAEVFSKDSEVHNDAKTGSIFRGEYYFASLLEYLKTHGRKKSETYKTPKRKEEVLSAYEKYKNFIENHKKDFIDTFRIYYRAIRLKYSILEDLKDLAKLFDKAFTNGKEEEEGIVLVGDKNVVKIVDRTSFSRINRITWQMKR